MKINKLLITSFLLLSCLNAANIAAQGIPTFDVGGIIQAIQQLEQAKKAYQNQLRQHEAALRGAAHDAKRYDKAFWKDDIKELERKLKEVNDTLDYYKKEYQNYADLFEREECDDYDGCIARNRKEEAKKFESEKQAVIAVQKELENQAQNLAQTQVKTAAAQKASLQAENPLQATQANTAMLQAVNDQLAEVRRLLIMQINMQKTAEANKIKEQQQLQRE